MPKALLLIDHGSKLAAANLMLTEVANVVRELKPELIIKIAHMELAEPTIAEGLRSCVDAGATEIIAHPYMLSPGRHSTYDIPKMVADCAQEFPEISYVVTEPLGVHHKIGEVILERSKLDNVD